MTLHKGASASDRKHTEHPVNPFYGEADPVAGMDDRAAAAHRLPDGPMSPHTAYQLVHDELMLDGNSRLNLATFVTTWMEPQAGVLMAECRDKNMIDKDEYPRTAELERRCVAMLADLWHAPDPSAAVGCSTTGSSEACMLAGMALKRRWMQAQRREPLSGRGPAEPRSWAPTSRCAGRSSATSGRSRRAWCRWRATASTWTRQSAAELCDENTIGVVGDPRLDLRRVVRAGGGDLRGARRAPGADRAGHPGPCGRRVRRDDRARSSTRSWSGTSGCRGSPRSTPRGTSTAWSTRASAGRCGAIRTRCPRSWSSGSTTWAATCRPSR